MIDMVHEKKKSGDPDYDDKVPMNEQAGTVVQAGDGRQVLMTDNVGPVDAVTGQHVDLDDPKGETGDNRPEPGGVAEKSSTVQTYTPEDTAMGDAKQVGSLEDAQKAAGQTSDQPSTQEVADAETPTSARKARKS